jgi:hypothetical protein
VRPNPSLERDLRRQGTWPAKPRFLSSASRAKRLPGSGPSAQTLGSTKPVLRHALASRGQGREDTASSCARCAVTSDALVHFVRGLRCQVACLHQQSETQVAKLATAPQNRPWSALPKTSRQVRRRCAAGLPSSAESSFASSAVLLPLSVACCLTLRSRGTSAGKPLGPRTAQCHHPLRGPSAFPATAPQLKR